MTESESIPAKRRRIDYLLLAAPSLSTPLLVWAENLIGVGHPERLLLIGMAVWGVGAMLLVLLRAAGVNRGASLFVTWVAIYVVMRVDSLPTSLGYLAAGITLAVALAIGGFLISRHLQPRLPALFMIASVLLAAEIALALYSSMSTLGPDRTQPPTEAIEIDLETTPDILVVIADAYVGVAGQSAFFDVGSDRHVALAERGFWIPDRAFSPYASTNAALPALLSMEYPILDGPGITGATNRSLYGMVGGDNILVDVLTRNGYEVTMIESGWSGSSCGSAIDTCVPSAFLDESVFRALEKTWFGRPVWERAGYAFTAGARHTMRWLSENAQRVTNDDKADLIFAHLEIPHPPLFLDENCDLNVTFERGGVTLLVPGVAEEVRKGDYLDQAACVDGFVDSIADGLSEETIVILAGDHGSDLRHQMGTHPADWTEEAVFERLNVMFAMKAPEGCTPPEPVLLTEVFGSVLSCLSDVDLPGLPPRMFIYAGVEFDGEPSPVLEVPPEEVGTLLSSGG